MLRRKAFTMLELIFAIVVIGILAKFGVEFLAQAYRGFIYTNVNHSLQSQSENAVEIIASRLQYRIKDSVIARTNQATFVPVAEANTTNFIVLEWIGEDADGFRGTQTPYWSGIVDINRQNLSGTNIISPATNTGTASALINTLSYTDSTLNDAALYYVGSNQNILGYGWSGTYNTNNSVAMNNVEASIHPINAALVDSFTITQALPVGFQDVYEYYKIAWTAYAIVMENYGANADNPNTGQLALYYDYQPWLGENYWNNGKRTLLAENVSSFQFAAMGSLLKVKVCVKSGFIDGQANDTTGTKQGYALCKDKTIF